MSCQIHSLVDWKPKTKQKKKKKKHPVAAEGRWGTRGDKDALEEETHTVPAETATAICRLRKSALSRIQYTTDTGLKYHLTFALGASNTPGAHWFETV